MEENGKHVLIISPEAWGKSKVSKHHYALAFANKGFKVYFLNPTISNSKKEDEVCTDHNNILLTYINFPYYLNKLRFHNRKLYQFFLGKKIRTWCRNHDALDYLVSFDCNGVFTNLSLFGAKKSIFFPVDQVNQKYRKEYRGFDTLVSISPVILRAFPDVKGQLMHHGLSPYFANNDYQYKPTSHLKSVAYVGNLLIGPILDRAVLKEIVDQNTNITFHFYGAYSKKGNNLGATVSEETYGFIEYLKAKANCCLHGTVSPKELAQAYEDIDAFLVCYDYKYDKNECSNSHKIMEYLATGKPIVSTRISMYDELDLFPMLDTFDNSSFANFFLQQTSNLKKIHNMESHKKRVGFARSNSYNRLVNGVINS